jgi:hypothetical protein
MTRVLQPELLDALPATDPRAIHSRRDLRRINSVMGNARVITRFLAQRVSPTRPLRIAEIGAGDGNIALQAARLFARGELILVDKNPSPPDELTGWSIRVEKADVFEWLSRAPHVDVILANLFLHHFEEVALHELLAGCAEHCDCFIAAEPRRNAFASWFARRVGLIGCNDVTQHDAVVSVRAGFKESELTALWPRSGDWNVSEFRSGFFTHVFGAWRPS